MAAKKSNPLNSAHTAGIFSDMSVDGPEIGTLVMVVDRAKNLPNRKTIGKQDPYCAARLGKEAKKTTTDIRGGQTPKWDQELRFTVHECPDYLQLKVSVFNDDKKTDLIGETWIDLREIVVAGGGQSDRWHNLNFRGKYAGEIRLEITYYDSRPKPEKVAAKPRPVASDAESPALPSQQAGQQAGGVPKRRPLPSEPPNGPSSAPAVAPELAQTPPRAQLSTPTAYIPKQSPLQAVEYNTPSPSGRYQQRSHHQSPVGTPGGGFSNTPSHQQDIPPTHQHQQPQRSPERHDKYPLHPEEPDFGPDDHSQYSSNYSQPSQPYERQEPRSPFDAGLDPYDHRGAAPIDDQRHPSLDEDRPPPPPVHRSRGSSGAIAGDMAYRNASFEAAQRGTPPTMRQEVLRSEAHRQSVSSSSYPGRPTYRAYDSAPVAPEASSQYQNGESHHHPSPPRHHSYDSAYDAHHRSMQPTVEDDPDSPSPLMTNSYRKSSSAVPAQTMGRHSEPDFHHGQVPAPLNLSGRNSASGQYGSPSAAPRHQHDRHNSNGYGGQSVSPGFSRDNYVVSPEPMGSRDTYSTSPAAVSPPRDYHQTSPVPGPSGSRDNYQTSPGPSSYNNHYNYNTTPTHRQLEYRTELEDTHIQHDSPSYNLPAVPPSLVPGVDPGLALELSSRINEGRRNEGRYNSAMSTPTRGRQMIDYHQGSSPQQYQTPPHQQQQHQSYQPQHQHQRSFDRSPVGGGGGGSYSNGPSPHQPPRGLSPHPPNNYSPSTTQHTIRRKSVSPAPPPRSSSDGFGADDGPRRLSGVPFGPDSYDELNPAVAAAVAAQEKGSRSGGADYNEATGKIITHDGREVDPSDHLPIETWAPEPEPKQPRPKPAPAQQQQDVSPSGGGLPLGPSGRRQLRVRPQSMSPVTYSSGNPSAAASTSALGRFSSGGSGNDNSMAVVPLSLSGPSNNAPLPAAAPGRNRLQKKANRNTSGGTGQPLAPLPPQNNNNNNNTPPRTLVRASTFDSNYEPAHSHQQNENHAPLVLYTGGGGGRGSGVGGGMGMSGGGMGYGAPPIPAKLPLPHGGGSPGMGGGGYRGGAGEPQVMSGALTGPSRLPWAGNGDHGYGGGSGGGYGGGGGGGGYGGGGGGGGGDFDMMEEMRRIDIGTGRARRHGGGGGGGGGGY